MEHSEFLVLYYINILLFDFNLVVVRCPQLVYVYVNQNFLTR